MRSRLLRLLAVTASAALLLGGAAFTFASHREGDPPPLSAESPPEEMAEFLLLMDMFEGYGEAIDVELELQADENAAEPSPAAPVNGDRR
jgi:hypothetical protein